MKWRLFLACFGLAAGLFAQNERGNITGVVTDSTGAVVPNVPVVITNLGTNIPERVSTTSSGEYNAPNLSPGTYRIEIAATGFKRFVEGGVTLTAGSTSRIDARLEVGSVGESIEVTAAAVQLQTENAKISTAVQNKLVDELPLVVGGVMRSPYDLVAIAAESKGSGTALSLGGGQAGAWSATLDGLLVNTNRSSDAGETSYLAPSVEAITEFSVDTNGFKAEFGQAGGGIITFVSKSGTNAYHGAAYDFLRNDDFDARGFFAPTRSIYKQNDFGATLGGPILVPKLYNGRNKTFFFFSYEGFRNRLGQNGSILSIPTPEMYQGDFSKLIGKTGALIPIYDPSTTTANPSGGFTRQPFANNQIPLSRFSNITKEMLALAPMVAPNRAGIVPGTASYVNNNYVVNNGSTTTPINKVSGKIDQNFGDRHHVAFFYNRSWYDSTPGPSGPPGLPEPLWNGQVTTYDAADYRVTYDWTISPRLLNHFSVGGNKFVKNSYSPNVGQNWKSKVCIPNAVDCNVNYPNVTFTEFTGWGSTAYNGTEQPMWAIKDDLSFIRGSHTMKFGYAFESPHAAGFGQQNISGNAGFSFLETAVPGSTSATSGSSFASFLLGAADTGATETIRYLPQIYDYHSVFVQDDWRITPRLMLNFGLRWEGTRPPFQPQSEYEDFSPTTPNPAVNNYPGALIFAGTGPGRVGSPYLVPGWYNGWGPRLGLAYGLDSKTTIRAGFARTFARSTVVSGTTHYDGFIGQYSFASTNQGVTPAFSWDGGLPPYPLPPQINPSFDNGNASTYYWQGQDATRMPEIITYTFSIQRQLSSSMVLEADYNGTEGAHLQTGLVNINQVPMSAVNALISQLGAAAAVSLLNSSATSAAAQAAGIKIPYPNFTDPTIQRAQSVAQALRPFPQYQTIDSSQSGDKSGHSTYNALVLKLDRRFARGLTMQWSYAFSKLLTDSDTYYANAGFAEDQNNRGLEKSIGAYDQTHVAKLSTIYELPVGKGKRWLTHGVAAEALGGWRISAIQVYSFGFPIGVTRNAPLTIFNGVNRPWISTYNWAAPYSGAFDPNKDAFLSAAAFPAQPAGVLGDATRFNPIVRVFPNYNENVSLGKSFHLTERFRLDYRAEAFNLFNRTVFSGPTTNLNSNAFGLVSGQSNSPRQMQMALKLYW